MTDTTWIKELREAASKATPGPWEADHSPDRFHTDVVYGRYQSGTPDHIAIVGGSELEQQNADAAYIALLSPDRIAALLSRLEELEAELNDMRLATKG